jgi:hypothetical protein
MQSGIIMIFSVLVQCTQVNMMLVMLPTVDRHIFQACPVWIYTQSNITSIISQYCFHNLQNMNWMNEGPGMISCHNSTPIYYAFHCDTFLCWYSVPYFYIFGKFMTLHYATETDILLHNFDIRFRISCMMLNERFW